ncbi:GNAT family N-acetyltransferase [Robiginitalea biformata]|uniref:GNAT family N-acetyltransferase n=1 Tax=Robiginitalea biformata TaxID=252307 RepID=UPI0002D3BE59|nr:GNAT family N-acetyltransferase [Robiginitalea biformata]
MVRTPIGLLLTLFRECRIPDKFSHVGKFGEVPIDAQSELDQLPCPPGQVCSFRLAPGYMQFHLKDPGDTLVRIPQQNWGYSIDLEGCATADDYLQKQFKSKYRSIIRRYVKRLDACFKTEYVTHGEDLAPDHYESLMEELKTMIDRRFGQRKESHKEEKNWKDILANSHDLIRRNKASLFVIYADGEPIEISLNYHFNGILFSCISSYDIDYSKFGLGHVEIYKQLEWCLANGFRVFEMGVGGMDYKRRWSNNIYQFEHLVIFKNGWPQNAKSRLEVARIRIREYLKSKKVNEIPHRLKSRFATWGRGGDADKGPDIRDADPAGWDGDWHPVDWISGEHAYLRSHVFDFLYSSEEQKKDVEVYESRVHPGHYAIRGAKKARELRFS